MPTVGILAYGSLIREPGSEIAPLITSRIGTMTPFPVEYARYSRTRGGGPTIVPHVSGCQVKSEILMLSDDVSLDVAKDILWRRETGNVSSERRYQESAAPNAVRIRDAVGFCAIDHVLYVDFNLEGKIQRPNARELAIKAINSVSKAASGRDGISYLIGLIQLGVETQLTSAYREQVLHLTGTRTLEEALQRTAMELANRARGSR